MKLNMLSCAALVGALAASPAAAQRTPSAHLRCDGLPDNISPGEVAARLVGAMTLIGLFAPPLEGADFSQRLNGAEGVATCDQALAGESNEVRRAQLLLARAIHYLEAGQFEQAIAQARAVDADRPALSASLPYRLSLRLSALEIEAIALVAMDRIPEARTKALEMAAAAPYDVVTLQRAARYVRLSSDYGPAEQRFFETGMRLYPQLILDRATARQMRGDFRGSSEDFEQWFAIQTTLGQDRQPPLIAFAALTRALAGDVEQAEAHVAEARRMIADDPQSAMSGLTSELLDLYRLWRMSHDGNVSNARLLFANRTTWSRFPAAIVSELARRLREGAPAAELTGELAGDPERFRAEDLQHRRSQIPSGKESFAAMQPFSPQAQFDRFANNVWRVDRSRYLQRQGAANGEGQNLSVERDGDGIPAGYAVLLHAALSAQAQGYSHFMLMPGRTHIVDGVVRFGNEGDERLVRQLSFDAAQVVRDISPIIARPVRR